MWITLLDRMLRDFVQEGALHVTLPGGTVRHYGGDGAAPVRITLHDPALPRRLVLQPELALGEAYTDGTLTVAGDDVAGLLALAARNRSLGRTPPAMAALGRITRPVQRWLAHNTVYRARRNVAHHYDLSAELYDLFLDADRQYSCAYFRDPDMDLDAAQEAKKRHIAAKLCLRGGERVLDIGCGWGGMALSLARDHGARVVGVTLSREQHRIATARVAEAGLSDRVEIRLQDYRRVEGPFDRIVSVGMFEHVGPRHYREYFDKLRALLTPEGIALVHTIGLSCAPRATSPWIRKWIFPGGYLPALSEIMAPLQRADLTLTDAEVWRLHYAETLRHWRGRFEAAAERVEAMYDARFVRMWRYYLCAAETGFRYDRSVVFQLQMSRDKTAVPATRDYLYGAAP